MPFEADTIALNETANGSVENKVSEILRSEAVTEIIFPRPGFLVRWGTTISFLF